MNCGGENTILKESFIISKYLKFYYIYIPCEGYLGKINTPTGKSKES